MCKKVAAIKKYLIAGVVFSSMALPLYGKDYNWSLEKASGFGTDCKYSKAKKELTVSVTAKTGEWGGVNLEHRKFGKDPDKVANWDNGFLVFEIKGGPDLKGVQRNDFCPSQQSRKNHQQNQSCEICPICQRQGYSCRFFR